MYSKHVELTAFEMVFRAGGSSEKDIQKFMDMFDQVYELGYMRGKQDAVLEAMMNENEHAI